MGSTKLKLLLWLAKYRKFIVPAFILIIAAVVYFVWFR